jgi:DNA-binding transcriptional MerR regulator
MSDSEHDPDAVWGDESAGERPDLPSQRPLSIENVARMFGVSQLTLRYYESRGLIHRRHRQNGLKVYGWADCERLAFIIKCRKADLPLGDIIRVIEAADEDVSPLQFKTGQETCMAMVDRLEQRRRVLGDALSELSHMYALLTSRLLGDNKPARKDKAR